MDARAILDNLLDSTQRATKAGMQMAEDKAILPPAGDERTAMLKGLGGGAAAAGAVALLFGSKGTRKFAGKALKLGGTAAIGGLAYKAYTEWQAAQGSAGQSTPAKPLPSTTSANLNLEQFDAGTPIAELPDREAEKRSESIIQAMISAARADGHIDDAELKLITQQIDSLALEKEITDFLLSELNKPVDVASIAALADTQETAAELYLASSLVVDMDSPAERQYLDRLAEAMNIDNDMKARLEEPLRG
ncbi:MAG: tellurite resistance TerB family protein [Granulosicoccus sp.]|nr:tellurite resistance TerB family protein [Granulosicoccus sp.]